MAHENLIWLQVVESSNIHHTASIPFCPTEERKSPVNYLTMKMTNDLSFDCFLALIHVKSVIAASVSSLSDHRGHCCLAI